MSKALNYQPLQLITIRAGEDIIPNRFININGFHCSNDQYAVGVSEISWFKGAFASVISFGTALIESAETINAGDKVASAADGKAKVAVETSEIIGTALTSSIAGRKVKVKISN